MVGHIPMSSGLAKMILLGTGQGKRRKVKQKKRWKDKVKERTGMNFASSARAVEDRIRWKGIVVKSSVVPQQLPHIKEVYPRPAGPALFFSTSITGISRYSFKFFLNLYFIFCPY